MPSASIRKKVYGLLRTTFSQVSTSEEPAGQLTDGPSKCPADDEDGAEEDVEGSSLCSPTAPTSSNSFISQCIRNRKNGMKHETEIYSGKTGLDLPVLMLESLCAHVRASYTGPEGGLTEVGSIRRQPIIRMANLDDELCLSFDGDLSEDVADEEYESQHNHLRQSSSGLIGSCTSLVTLTHGTVTPRSDTENYDWKWFDEERCFGISTTLYERNPLTGVNAGNPIADAFAVVARDNNVVMALADGVNWGEGARLAARCAIRGAIDHLNYHLFVEECSTTTEVFHRLLGAFHSAHALILQEGGLLTTLCVAVAVQLKQSTTWVLCVCNVGDSLCFVYSPQSGVREVTVASHDICRMRDMRDAGGALGPVDGTNPQLQNLTCSMTFVEPDDVIFITSDGVSDNFDPVVGKFCIIRKPSENENLSENVKPVAISMCSENKGRDSEFARTRTCNASLPCVSAEQRHELMLLRMGDIIANGILPPSCSSSSPARQLPGDQVIVSASKLCHNLIQFARQLSMAKRRTLEDPELYQIEKRLSKSEQRSHRKMVRCKLSEMPGKLDHATVVAFKVGIWPDSDDAMSDSSLLANGELSCSASTVHYENWINEKTAEGGVKSQTNEDTCKEITCTANFVVVNDFTANVQAYMPCFDSECEAVVLNVNSDSTPFELSGPEMSVENRSPYEETPVTFKAEEEKTRRKHPRGSIGRHTLSVDVAWLKKFVMLKNTTNGVVSEAENQTKNGFAVEMERPHSLTLRQRLRSLMGSARSVIQTSTAGTPNSDSASHGVFSKKVSSASSSPRKKPPAY